MIFSPDPPQSMKRPLVLVVIGEPLGACGKSDAKISTKNGCIFLGNHKILTCIYVYFVYVKPMCIYMYIILYNFKHAAEQ